MIAADSRGRWQQAQVLSMLPPNASVTANSGLNTIACPTPRSCVAAGTYQDVAGGSPAMYLPESGGIWSKVGELALPLNAAAPRFADPIAEDCSGSGFCAIVGAYSTTPAGPEAMAALTR
jgi:hypothetical protein